MASKTPETQCAMEEVVFQIIAAVRLGQKDVVKSILQEQGNNFPVQDILNCGVAERIIMFSLGSTITVLNEACEKANDEIQDPQKQKEALEIVKLLLENGADPNTKAWSLSEEVYLIPLHMAVLKSNLALTRVLLEGEAQANQMGDDRSSSMHLCCTNKYPNRKNRPDLEILTTSIKHKADVNLRDKDGGTPLYIDNGASANIPDKTGECLLHEAVNGRNVGLMHTLLESKASVNQTNHDGQSALHLCCGYSGRKDDETNLEIQMKLIDHKADVDLQDNNGQTPLHLSIKAYNDNQTVDLLRNGASASIQDRFGRSPLHLACSADPESELIIVEKLLDAGASVNLTDCLGLSALHTCYSPEIATTLINYNADVNLEDKSGHTPLHASCLDHDSDITKALLLNGAAVNKTDKNGQSPLHMFCKRTIKCLNRSLFNEFSLNSLMEFKADVNLQDKKGRTPMHISCADKAWDLTMPLIENGALVTIQDDAGISPLHLAFDDHEIMLRMIRSCEFRQNEDKEVISEAYELAALPAPDSFECMRKATLLRIEHGIPKRMLEPMECYGFCKEWETMEELEPFKMDEKHLKFQAILARERIHQGQPKKLLALIRDDLIEAVLAASQTDAGKLLKRHLIIWSSYNPRHWYSMVLLGEWKNKVEEYFESLDTTSVVKLIQIATDILPLQNDKTDAFSIATTLIGKLCRRNGEVKDSSKNERMLAKELLQLLLDKDDMVDWTIPLPHLIMKTTFSFPRIDKELISHSPCDYDLVKMLLDSGIDVNAVDCEGNTMLHSAVHCLAYGYGIHRGITLGPAKPRFDQDKFSEDVVNLWIMTIKLLLDNGVYPNAKNIHGETARDLLGMVIHEKKDKADITRMVFKCRIDDLLQQYEHEISMSLKHKAAVVIKESHNDYTNSLPSDLVKFVDLLKLRAKNDIWW